MEQPNSKFTTMGNTAAKTAGNPSGAPERGKLVKRGNAVAGTLDGPTAVKPQKQVTSKRAYGIKTSMPAWKDPQIGPTQGNGRLFKEAVNRSSITFVEGIADHN